MDEKDERAAYLALSLNPVFGNHRIFEGIKRAGSARNLCGCTGETLAGFLSSSIRKAASFIDAVRNTDIEPLTEELARKEITPITPADEEYPPALMNIYDPPLCLYRIGLPLEASCEYLAVVGTRKATHYGLRAARRILSGLPRKIAIVSGMALGIDAEAHKAALGTGLYTVAVLGSGVDYIYPASNRMLYGEIRERGTILSEYLPGSKPERYTFPRRNRIISGMSRGVLVVECGKKSGSLITAGFGLEQGRDIFAVPGSILSGSSRGTNDLIRQGAFPVLSTDDITIRWGIEAHAPKGRSGIVLTEMEKEVISHMSVDEPFTIEELIVKIDGRYPPGSIASAATALALKGAVEELQGKRFVIKQEDDR